MNSWSLYSFHLRWFAVHQASYCVSHAGLSDGIFWGHKHPTGDGLFRLQCFPVFSPSNRVSRLTHLSTGLAGEKRSHVTLYCMCYFTQSVSPSASQQPFLKPLSRCQVPRQVLGGQRSNKGGSFKDSAVHLSVH